MMKKMSDRRVFIQNLSKGIFSTVLTFTMFKPGLASGLIQQDEPPKNQLPRINAAYKMNVFTDGKVELYTHKSAGDKLTLTFDGLEADVLLKLSKKNDPKLCVEELGPKYNLGEVYYLAEVNSILKSMEDRGIIYSGDLMLVKIVEAKNE